MSLTIQACKWTDKAAEVLAAGCPNTDIINIKAQVDHEGAELFSVSKNGEIVAFYVLRIDHLITHNEGVVVVAAGFDAEFNLTDEVLPVIEKNQFQGCKSIRLHTSRPGLIRKLTNSGYTTLEFVLSKGL